MWTPTHVQVTVQRAKGLLYKGKNGTNDVFVTIGLGKEKYQTSVKERATDPVTWQEECELPIPKQGNKAEIILTVLHRNFLGDEFLGMINIALCEFDVYEKPKNRWYILKSKPGKEKNKNRGELEVRIGFTVVASNNSGSLADLTKKSHKSSIGQLASSVGGSLLSLGKEKKSLKSLVKSVGNKVSTLPGRGKKKGRDDAFGAIPEQTTFNSKNKKLNKHDADPGVLSDEEDEFHFDELSHKSSHSSLAISQRDGSLENLGGGEFLRRNYATPPPPQQLKSTSTMDKEIVSGSNVGLAADSFDDWEAKLFGKQNNNRSSPLSTEQLTSSPRSSPSCQTKSQLGANALKFDDSIKSEEIVFDVVKAEKQNDNEPIPKPRQIQEIIKSESKLKSLSLENISTGSKTYEKPKKEKHKHISKESFTSIFGSKTKLNEESKGSSTPVGITNPIRVKASSEQESRLPKEVIRKFEGKSREDLIEMIMTLQLTVDSQKQKMSDMEDYIDNLLVRVMENKPTLLQNSNGVEETGSSLALILFTGKGLRSTARTID